MLVAACAWPLPSLALAQPHAGGISGIVEVAGPDGQPFVVPGVTLTVTCPAAGGAGEPIVRTGVTDAAGAYAIAQVPAGECDIVAELEGFQSAQTTVRVEPKRIVEAPLRLGFDTLRESVTVTASVDTNPVASTAAPTRLEQATLQQAPIATERFQDALPLIPGVVRGPDGLLNINGSRSNQTGLTVNQANGTDPVTGEFALEVPIDAVESVNVQQAAYAPEFGQSGGAMASVETQQGGDAWRVQVNNFMPRIRRRGNKIVGLESFTPRLTVGGPIVKGRLNVLGSVQYALNRTRVESLPPFESDTEQEGFDAFTRLDWRPTDRHHASASAVVSPRTQRYVGLNTFNPQSVTPSIDSEGALISARDQIVAHDTGVLDLRVGYKQFDVEVYPSRPGDRMRLTPDVNQGAFFNSQDRTSRRVEWVTTYTLTPAAAPSHLFKLGGGATFESFDGASVSRPVDVADAAGRPIRTITFSDAGTAARDRTLVSAYAQDTWTLGSRATLLYGFRADRDSAGPDLRVSPRASITIAASDDGRTTIRAGVGLFQSPPPLNVLAFDALPQEIVHDPGAGVDESRIVEHRLGSDLRMSSSVNWEVAVERAWLDRLTVRLGYRQRDGRFEPLVHPEGLMDGVPAAIEARTDGRTRYREGQVTARYTFGARDQVVGSYTRSSSRGDLNAFNAYFGNVYNPIVPENEYGPLPWDAPNRVLVWGSVGLPHGFDVFPVLDVRDGFPLSTLDASRAFVGPRNRAGRFPLFVSLDVQVTKRIVVLGHGITLGLKVFNLTDHFNPRDYFGNIDGLRFGDFANGVGRTFRAKFAVEF